MEASRGCWRKSRGAGEERRRDGCTGWKAEKQVEEGGPEGQGHRCLIRIYWSRCPYPLGDRA